MSYHSGAVRLASPAPTFEQIIGDAMRSTVRSARPLSEKDAQFAQDIQRARGIVGLNRWANMARRCSSLSDALALPRALGGYILANHPAINCDATSALRDEVAASGSENQALFEFMATRSRGARERLIEALHREECVSHVAIEALQHGGAVRSLELVGA